MKNKTYTLNTVLAVLLGAALLMTSLPVPEPLMPPELPSAACTAPADAENAEDPAARKP